MTWQRVATAAVLIPVVVAAVLLGSTEIVASIAALVTVLALLEFLALGEPLGLRGYRLWTCGCAVGVFFQQWATSQVESHPLFGGGLLTRGPAVAQIPLELVLFVFVAGAAAIVFVSREPLADGLGNLSISAAGLVFVALPFSAVVRLDGVPAVGPRLLLFVLVMAWAGDTAAYLVGRAFGHLPMAPQLSPKKTWEGSAANLLAAVIVGLAFAKWLQIEAVQMVAMAAIGNVFGQAGDILKSVYKRSAGVKDSGKLLPGHGGMLDRIDSLVLAAPAVWYYFQFIVSPRG